MPEKLNAKKKKKEVKASLTLFVPVDYLAAHTRIVRASWLYSSETKEFQSRVARAFAKTATTVLRSRFIDVTIATVFLSNLQVNEHGRPLTIHFTFNPDSHQW